MEVLEVLPFLLAAVLASMAEASLSPSLLQPVQPWLGAAEQGAFRSAPALPYLARSLGQAEVWSWPQGMDRVGKQSWGWDTSACWGGRLATAQLPQEEVCGGEEASLGPWRALLPEETQKAERCSACPLPLQ